MDHILVIMLEDLLGVSRSVLGLAMVKTLPAKGQANQYRVPQLLEILPAMKLILVILLEDLLGASRLRTVRVTY